MRKGSNKAPFRATSSRYSSTVAESANNQSKKRVSQKRSVYKRREQFYRSIPPVPKDPRSRDSLEQTKELNRRKSKQQAAQIPPPIERVKDGNVPQKIKKAKARPHKRKNKGKINIDHELKALDENLPDPSKFEPDLDEAPPEFRLEVLDEKTKAVQLSPRDLIEAFYSKYDITKLEEYTHIERFITFVEQHNLKELSDKLCEKYGESLEDENIVRLARRRKNLEEILITFYLQHDPNKIRTRWVVLKIVSWAMQRGLPKLNEKFCKRYGEPVVNFT